MTRDPAVLKKFIEDAEREMCVEFLLCCSPEELREMWLAVKEVIPLVLEQDNRAIPFASDKEGIARRLKDIERCRVLGLAVLATGSFSDMKKLPWGCDPLDKPDILIRLLRGVEVPWLSSWVNFLVEHRRNSNYECLIRAGFCKPPNNDSYVLGFFSFGRKNHLESSRIDQNFLDVIAWKFFEVEGGGDRSLAAVDKYTGKEEFTWAYALKKLCEEGKLSRARLLDASLDALGRDFAQFRAGWFSRFHEYMEPSTDERAERVGSYLRLLASSIPPTVSFALHALKIVDSAGKLPSDELIQRLPPVLLAKNKSAVMAALGLLETIAVHQPQMRSVVLKVAVEGFVSEIIQVQGRIIKLLSKYSSSIDDSVRNRLVELADAMSPSSRKELINLLPKANSSSVETSSIPDTQGDSSVPSTPLDPSQQIIPISGIEELIEKASYLLENETDLTEAERVFDGLVRFPINESPSFQKAAQPLLKRARQLYEKHGGSPEPEPPAISSLALLIYAWLLADDMQAKPAFGQPIELQLPGIDYNFKRERQQAFKFHFLRLNGILQSIINGTKLPLLSTPTHLGFWIDPGTLVDRIAKWSQKGEPVAQDVVVAFLRMGSEHRKEALASARGLSGELGAALRYALGADESIGNEPWMWIAASRARFREADDPALEKAFPGMGPGAAQMPRITWVPSSHIHKYKDAAKVEHSITFFRLDFLMEPPAPAVIPLAHLPVLLHSEKYCYHDGSDSTWPIVHGMPRWAFRAFLSYWPSWREPIYFNGLLCCGSHTTYLEVSDHSVFLLFDALSDPYEEFHPNARLLLNFGLSCLHADGRTSAVNGFVSGINHQRLSPELLGQSMQLIFSSGLIHPARVRKSLDEIVRVSPTHRRAVLEYLTELMKGDPVKAPDNMVKLLELYHELLLEHKESVRDAEVLAYLKAFPGGGRAAKLAKQITALV